MLFRHRRATYRQTSTASARLSSVRKAGAPGAPTLQSISYPVRAMRGPYPAPMVASGSRAARSLLTRPDRDLPPSEEHAQTFFPMIALLRLGPQGSEGKRNSRNEVNSDRLRATFGIAARKTARKTQLS